MILETRFLLMPLRGWPPNCTLLNGIEAFVCTQRGCAAAKSPAGFAIGWEIGLATQKKGVVELRAFWNVVPPVLL
jgi:hypothetical protein